MKSLVSQTLGGRHAVRQRRLPETGTEALFGWVCTPSLRNWEMEAQ